MARKIKMKVAAPKKARVKKIKPIWEDTKMIDQLIDVGRLLAAMATNDFAFEKLGEAVMARAAERGVEFDPSQWK